MTHCEKFGLVLFLAGITYMMMGYLHVGSIPLMIGGAIFVAAGDK